MNKRLIIVVALAFTIAAVAVSIFVIKPPKPIVEITGEPLATVGPLDILNTLFTAWVIIAVLLIFVFFATRKIAMVPSGLYNFFEAVIEGIYNFVTGIAGEHQGRKFFPLIATFFIYIAFANWLSLTPVFNSIGMFVPLHEEESEFHEHALVFKGDSISVIPFGAQEVEVHAEDCATGHEGDACRGKAIEEASEVAASGEKVGVLFPYFRGINTDLMTPLSFAIFSAIFVEYWGISALGFRRYISKFVNLKGPIDFFVGLLELIAELARLISFSFRLFGNMLAGEILLLVMTFLVAVASPILVIFYGLELFVGAIQAFVFGTLTLVFGVLAVTSHDEHGDEAHH